MSFQFPDNRIRITVFSVTPIPSTITWLISPFLLALLLHLSSAHCALLHEPPGNLAVISQSLALQTTEGKSSSVASKNGNLGKNIHKSVPRKCKEIATVPLKLNLKYHPVLPLHYFQLPHADISPPLLFCASLCPSSRLHLPDMNSSHPNSLTPMDAVLS